jgi:hypothetical protein
MTLIESLTIGFASIAVGIWGLYYSSSRDKSGIIIIKGQITVLKHDDPDRFRRIMRYEYGAAWLLNLFGIVWLTLLAVR